MSNPTFKILKEVVQTPDGKMFGTMAEASDYWGQQRYAMALNGVARKLNNTFKRRQYGRSAYVELEPSTIDFILSSSGFRLDPAWQPQEGQTFDSDAWTGRQA